MPGEPVRRSGFPKSRLSVAVALLSLVASAAVAAPDDLAPRYAGQPLERALLDLQSRGLKIVFTSQLVRPAMRVEREPAGDDLRDVLDQLLAPHGLASVDGPDGTVIVVPAAAAPGAAGDRGSIRGAVRSSAGEPVAGARVRLEGTELRATSGADGSFVLDRVAGGEHVLEARAPGFVFDRLEAVVVREGETTRVTLVLAPTPVIEEELVVTPSRVSLLRKEPMTRLGLTREEILALPHLGEDFFRALTLLPGTLANDVSAQFHVRGGRRDETQILIDGQELYDAFHLKERDNAVSLVATGTLSSADLTTGGFSAEYGDRMTGVLDMTTLTPAGRARFRAGVGFLSAQLGGGGRFAADRGSWLVELRRGTTDLVGRLLGDEDPEYWDGFAKLDYRFDEGSGLRLNALSSGDELDFRETVDGELKVFGTEYDSTYLWLTHQVLLGSRLAVDTAAASTSIQRDRRALELEEDASFDIFDQRDLDVTALRQDWRLRSSRRSRLIWGWRLRGFDTVYDYFSSRDFDNPLALIRHDSPRGSTDFRGRFEEEQHGAYLADRLEVDEQLTVELGLRFDHHTQTDESHLAPRLNLAWAPGERSVLRLAWGRYHQSQRPYELQVEDGDNTFQPVERSEHRVLGYERLFPGAGRRATTLRLELYERRVGNPRRRYENLYEPINSFPEAEPDRVLVAADRVRARGLEIFARGAVGDRVAWWANYTYSVAEDRVAGRWQRRLFDQTHALNLDLDWRIGERWRLNLAWRYHTGWPTTPLGVAAALDEDGETTFVPVLGAINSRRLADYHRLDLRASRQWTVRAVDLSFYVDVQNAYNRKNPGGFDIEIDPDDGSITTMTEPWPGLLPSAGLAVEF